MTAPTIILVEDDPPLRTLTARALQEHGYQVRPASSGPEMWVAFDAGPVDLVVLDVMLPGTNGIDLCRQIRRKSDVPIIFISAKGSETDRIVGLELGADDYLPKPFGTRELIARVRAVARRAAPGPEPEGPQQIGSLVIDRRTRRVTIDGEELALTPKEFDLLALLGEDPGAVVTREHIMDEVWDPHWYGPTKTLDVHIASLRRKLGDPTWVETVRSVGFRLRDHS